MQPFESFPPRLVSLRLSSAIAFAFAPLAFGVMNVEPVIPAAVPGFFEANCVDCHDEESRKGELDLTSLKIDPSNPSSLKLWSLIHDRVRDKEMPPKKKAWPTDEERGAFLGVFEETLHDVSKKRHDELGRVQSRRLDRIEYENTIHDLLGIDLPMGKFLPEDPSLDGFSNVAEAQQISYHLLERHMEIVDYALDEAFRKATEPAPVFHKTFHSDELGVGRVGRSKNERQPFDHLGHSVAFASTHGFHGKMDATTVPEAGWYRIKLKAKAHNPPEGRGVWTKVNSGICRAHAPLMYWIGSFEARVEPEEFTWVAWIEKDHMLEIKPGDRTLDYVNTKNVQDSSVLDLPDAPGVAVEYVEMERIDLGLEPAIVKARLFGDLAVESGEPVSPAPAKDLRRLVAAFAERAFRRPADTAEVEPYVAFAEEALASTGSMSTALRSGYRAVLSSPRFIYFVEKPGKLDDFGIASRLSYFLWSTCPDDELMRLAKAGRLSRPDVIAQQVERLLNDPRAEAFVANFTDSWLSLKDIDATSPDEKLYPEFDEILKHGMVAETRAFLAEMLRNDLSVSNVIDSDFAMLNERLARHYGIEGVSGTGIRKVPLDHGSRRGGIITQGSVLKVTANGTTTSPVIRGVWLLKRILGTEIPPPPDTVSAIEPDIRGAVSIRDQLDKHRTQSSCMTCHYKIDPPGFALESFDVIGGWRENYRAMGDGKKWTLGPAVDPSYDAFKGQSFEDVDGFKRLALSDTPQVARNLMSQVLTYATGARTDFADRREIDHAVEELARNGYGLRSLIHAAAQSSIFLSK